MNNQRGAKIAAVPFTGCAPIVQALITNEVQISNIGVGNFLGHIEAGTIKPLAVTSSERSKLLRQVPTFREAVLGNISAQAWWGLEAQKGTPQAAITALNAEFVRLFNEPDFKSFLEERAGQPMASPTR